MPQRDAPPAKATRPPAAPPPTVAALFWGFLSISIIGFGGVLPWARRLIVEQRRWLTGAEFTDLLGLCQFLPGPNIVNLSVALGSRFRGLPGALAAMVGLLTLPMLLVVALGTVYAAWSDHPVVARATAGAPGAPDMVKASRDQSQLAPRRFNWPMIVPRDFFFCSQTRATKASRPMVRRSGS